MKILLLSANNYLLMIMWLTALNHPRFSSLSLVWTSSLLRYVTPIFTRRLLKTRLIDPTSDTTLGETPQLRFQAFPRLTKSKKCLVGKLQQRNFLTSDAKMLARNSYRSCRKQLDIAPVTRAIRRQSTTSNFNHHFVIWTNHPPPMRRRRRPAFVPVV